MRVLICGSRHTTNAAYVRSRLNDIMARGVFFEVVIHGGAAGVDTLAGEWAIANEVPCLVYPANWSVHGRRAGPLRNKQMIDEGKPTIVIAFPGGLGTQDMVKQAEEARLTIFHVEAPKPSEVGFHEQPKGIPARGYARPLDDDDSEPTPM